MGQMTTLTEPISVTDRILMGDADAETGLLRAYLRGAAVLATQHGLPQDTACEAASVVVERIRNGEVRAGSQIATAIREAVILLSGRPRRADSQQIYVAKKQAADVSRAVIARISDARHRALIYRLFVGGLTPEQVSGELEIEPEQLRVWLRATIEAFRMEDGGEALIGQCDAGPAAAPRYVLDQLTAVEKTLFEEHYVGCECCAEFVLTASRLRLGMPVAAAEEAGDVARQEPLRMIAARWLSNRTYWGQASAVIGASVLLALVPSMYMLAKSLGRSDRAAAPVVAKKEKPSVKAGSYNKPSPFVPPVVRTVAAVAPVPVEPPAPAAAGGVLLKEGAGWTPQTTIRLAGKPVVLQMDRAADKTAVSYTGAVYSSDGRPVQWELNAKASPAGLLTITVGAEKLTGQIYTVVMEGVDGAGKPAAKVKYSFQIAR